MKCVECGERMRDEIAERHDVSDIIGIKLQVLRMPILRCPNCGATAIAGRVLSNLMAAAATAILRLPSRLPADFAKYLRRMLGFTQEELANRMDLARETVGQWECGSKPISSHNDFMLRTIAITTWAVGSEPGVALNHLDELLASLRAVQPAPPEPDGLDPVVVQRFLDEAPRATPRATAAAKPTS